MGVKTPPFFFSKIFGKSKYYTYICNMENRKIKYKKDFLIYFTLNKRLINDELVYGYTLSNSKMFLLGDTTRIGYLRYLRNHKKIDKIINNGL